MNEFIRNFFLRRMTTEKSASYDKCRSVVFFVFCFFSCSLPCVHLAGLSLLLLIHVLHHEHLCYDACSLLLIIDPHKQHMVWIVLWCFVVLFFCCFFLRVFVVVVVVLTNSLINDLFHCRGWHRNVPGKSCCVMVPTSWRRPRRLLSGWNSANSCLAASPSYCGSVPSSASSLTAYRRLPTRTLQATM